VRCGRVGRVGWGFEPEWRANGLAWARPDDRLSGRAAAASRWLPAGGDVRCARRLDGARSPAAPAAAVGTGVRCCGRDNRGAEPRCDDRAAHADRVRNRCTAPHQPSSARVRVLSSGQYRIAAVARLEPHQPACLPRERSVVCPVRRADDAPVAGRPGDRMVGPESVIRRRPGASDDGGRRRWGAPAPGVRAVRGGRNAGRVRV
jgi:hypothetical protein